ncbi:MAG: hypothetical protein ABI583_06935 [Betaproteobacteria bacterium]
MRKHKALPSDLIWIPGIGPDELARQRLMKAFPRPSAPMGEAWFMSGERKMYTGAIGVPFEKLEPEVVGKMFDEIVTGPPCFGQLDEWRNWFHYLLPNLIPKALKQPSLVYVAEWLVGAAFSQHPDGLEDYPYRGFRSDVLATLGHVVMSPEIWDDGKLKWEGGLFHESRKYSEVWWYFDRTSPPVSAMLFFCLKYLRPNQIEPWLRSAIEIDCPLWRSQLIVWLTGAQRMLSGEISQPNEFGELEWSVNWEWSHVISGNYSGDFSKEPAVLLDAGCKPIASAASDISNASRHAPFIPEINLLEFRKCFKKLMPRDVRELLSAQTTALPLLKREMGNIPVAFEELELSTAA